MWQRGAKPQARFYAMSTWEFIYSFPKKPRPPQDGSPPPVSSIQGEGTDPLMALLVLKFGGSSVADRARIYNVARIIAQAQGEHNRVVVAVSAQGDTTDHLLAAAADVSPHPAPRELDMLLATGEQASAALLCMALAQLGVRAVSLTGWQAGFHTDRLHTRARIRRLQTERLESELDKNQVVVVAGFQGLDSCEDITTLGRGGSDTSAVALACALGAQRCLIYTDVDGVYTADPRIVPRARRLPCISYDEMLELASVGAQVLHSRSVEMARRYGMPLEVLSSLRPGAGTTVREVCGMEGMLLKSVTADASVSLLRARLHDTGAPLRLLRAMAGRHIPVRQVLQDGLGLQLLTPDETAPALRELLQTQAVALGVEDWQLADDSACISVVGSGLASDASALPRLLEALGDAGHPPLLLTAGELRVSALVQRQAAQQAVRAVHAAFFEDDGRQPLGAAG